MHIIHPQVLVLSWRRVQATVFLHFYFAAASCLVSLCVCRSLGVTKPECSVYTWTGSPNSSMHSVSCLMYQTHAKLLQEHSLYSAAHLDHRAGILWPRLFLGKPYSRPLRSSGLNSSGLLLNVKLIYFNRFLQIAKIASHLSSGRSF